MFKGKEGIALILAIVFMLAITILLSAVLLLSTQEINATQLYLDSNKALYYAEAGVEYAQARILKTIESGSVTSDTINNIKDSVSNMEIFNDNNIKTLSLNIEKLPSGIFTTIYRISCEVRYKKATRKITKVIRVLDKELDKAIASKGNIVFKFNKGQETSIYIDGDLYAEQYKIIFENFDEKKTSFKLDGTAYASEVEGYNLPIKPISEANFTFPSVDITSYRSSAKYYIGTNPPSGAIRFNTVDDFINALKSSNPPADGIVYVDGDFHINNLNNISIRGLTFVINGELSHANNIDNISVGSENNAVEFIAKNVFINNVSNVDLANSVMYATESLRFVNITNININGGALYLAPALGTEDKKIEISLELENVKAQLNITSLPEAQKKRGSEDYFVLSWSDASV